MSISFWPLEALRDFFCFGAVSALMLCFNASIRSTTFAPLGRGLWADGYSVPVNTGARRIFRISNLTTITEARHA